MDMMKDDIAATFRETYLGNYRNSRDNQMMLVAALNSSYFRQLMQQNILDPDYANAAAIDTRIKATVTTTMYDMTRVTANGYFDTDDNPDARYALRQALNTQRTADYKAGTYQRAGGVVDPLPEDAPFFVKDYHDYYKTPRGYHPRSLNSTGGWNVTSTLSLLNAKLLAYAGEIRSAVLMIHGDKAHSCYFSRDAFARLQGDNKELLLIPGAVHTDLYDRMDIIPFGRIEAFYHQYLK